MNKSLLLATFCLLVLVSSNDACSSDAWRSGNTYNGNDLVMYNGRAYKAQYWNSAQRPDLNHNGPWQLEDYCGTEPECADPWRSAVVYIGGDKVVYRDIRYTAKWQQSNNRPGNSYAWERDTDQCVEPPLTCDGTRRWDNDHWYLQGETVVYNGILYRALQDNQCNVPGNTETFWEEIFYCETSTTRCYIDFSDCSAWSDSRTTTCDGIQMIGGYRKFGNGASTSRTISNEPSHSSITVSYTAHFIDSWDNSARWGVDESLILEVDGAEVQRTPGYGGTQQHECGSSRWTDKTLDITSDKITHSGDLTLRFSSSLTQGASDESWGISEVCVTYHKRCELPYWRRNTVYTAGQKCSFRGKGYVAKVWTSGNRPDQVAWAWEEIDGDC